ncbi:hypothetical protein VP01_2908g1 [Puccinia sorghi]|uniref:Uncharacterized protein n=1 Tax=Puccinia sorghi TaxID=27349 RepID=A0A0L6V377_9BASI|nr:hypothetical protein VP01_2908g1 [Puccinia sorghi]
MPSSTASEKDQVQTCSEKAMDQCSSIFGEEILDDEYIRFINVLERKNKARVLLTCLLFVSESLQDLTEEGGFQSRSVGCLLHHLVSFFILAVLFLILCFFLAFLFLLLFSFLTFPFLTHSCSYFSYKFFFSLLFFFFLNYLCGGSPIKHIQVSFILRPELVHKTIMVEFHVIVFLRFSGRGNSFFVITLAKSDVICFGLIFKHGLN